MGTFNTDEIYSTIFCYKTIYYIRGEVVGSAPYCDPDPVANIHLVFGLAAEFNVPVDFHLVNTSSTFALLVHH